MTFINVIMDNCILSFDWVVLLVLFSQCQADSRYIGCYEDSIPRLLPYNAIYGDTMTVEKCIDHCRDQHTYAGMEYSSQCFCGSSLTGAISAPEDECNYKCAGNNAQTCGGKWKISVYRTVSTTTATTSTSTEDRTEYTTSTTAYLTSNTTTATEVSTTKPVSLAQDSTGTGTYVGAAVGAIFLLVLITVIIIAYRRGRLRRLSHCFKHPRDKQTSERKQKGVTNIGYDNEHILQPTPTTSTNRAGVYSLAVMPVTSGYEDLDIRDGAYSLSTYTGYGEYNTLGSSSGSHGTSTECSEVYNKLGDENRTRNKNESGVYNELGGTQTSRLRPDEYSNLNKVPWGNNVSSSPEYFVLEPDTNAESQSSVYIDQYAHASTSPYTATGDYNQLGDVTRAGADLNMPDKGHLQSNETNFDVGLYNTLSH